LAISYRLLQNLLTLAGESMLD